MKQFVSVATKIFSSMLLILFASNTITLSQAVYAQENVPQFLYGIASWYGDDFEGKQTASGEIYSSSLLTAAHKSLPFGTRVLVENLSNGKKVEAIINDRGPIAQNRIIELSKQAAEVLSMLTEGTTFVKVTILELGTSLPTPVSDAISPIGNDIPPGFNPNSISSNTNNIQSPVISNASPVAVNSELDEDLNNLFADAEDELSYMDDEDNILASQPTDLKTQELPGFNKVPQGFNKTEDVLIDDPLTDILLGPEDEFVAAPLPPDAVLNTAPNAFNASNKNLFDQNTEDPFADLFSDSSDYEFQNNNIIVDEVLPVSEDVTIIVPPVTVTNYSTPVTNIVTLPGESITLTNYAQSQPTVVTIPPAQQLADHFVIQVGAFSKQKNAMTVYEKLRQAGLSSFITDVKVKGQNIIRVRVGYFSTMDEAIAVSQRITEQFGLENRVIKIEYDQ